MATASCFESGVFWKAAAPPAVAWDREEVPTTVESRSKSLSPAMRELDVQRLHELGRCIAIARSIASGLHLGPDGRERERIQRLKALLLRITQGYAHEAYGGAELERVSLVSASELLRTVCRDCRKRADPKRVGIVLNSCHSVASVQPMAFAKAIRELVDNAVAASRAGQTVSVSVFTTSAGDLLWQVRDDGAGMPAKLLSDLGEPHRATKRGGLGVVVARIIVDEHRGLLHFESTPALGTTATIWLPRRRAVPVG